MSFIFETICFGIGYGVLKVVTLGRYRPKPDTNPFAISFLGVCVLIGAFLLIYFLAR